ncbi:MAG: glycerophosphodiester phosphodiesterase family protein [Acidobacteriota bacterium]
MTMLGRANPLERIARGLRGKIWPARAPVPTSPRACRVVAHRGAARVRPENTIEAYATAMDLGADAVEADVCVTRDGRFVIWHDADPGDKIALARQTGRENLLFTPDVPTLVSRWRRRVRDLDFEEFRAHYGYGRRKGGLADLIGSDDPPQVPPVALDDLIAWAGSEPRLSAICLDIKLKHDQGDAAVTLYEKLSRVFADHRGRSFPSIALLTPQREIAGIFLREAARQPHDERLTIHGDFELPGVLAEARRFRLRHVSMGLGQRFWPGFRDEVADVVRARERGELDSVILWTINEPDQLRELVSFAPDGILTDDPPLLRGLLLDRRLRATEEEKVETSAHG